jgi:hypothetical protein
MLGVIVAALALDTSLTMKTALRRSLINGHTQSQMSAIAKLTASGMTGRSPESHVRSFAGARRGEPSAGDDGSVLKACLNGARSMREHPALPVTAADLARDAA